MGTDDPADEIRYKIFARRDFEDAKIISGEWEIPLSIPKDVAEILYRD